MKRIVASLAIMALASTAVAGHVVDIVFADNPTQTVSAAIGEDGNVLKDYDQYIIPDGANAGMVSTNSNGVGIGTRIQVSSFTITNGIARCSVEASKHVLNDRATSAKPFPGFRAYEFTLTINQGLNLWLQVGQRENTLTSEFTDKLDESPGTSGIRVREFP